MFLPLLEANDCNDGGQNVLEGLVSILSGALDDVLVVVWEHFVFFEDHSASPRTVVNCKVDYPLVGSCGWDFIKKTLEVFLGLQFNFIEESQLSHRSYLLALLEEGINSYIATKGQ